MKYLKTTFLLLFVLVLLPDYAVSQSIIKRSIGTNSGVYTDHSITVWSCTGQPFNTVTHYSGNREYRPGFIQPFVWIPPDLVSTPQMKAYPNPASAILTLELSGISSNVTVEVYSALGLRVHSSAYQELQQTSIDCSNWAKGLYVVTVIQDSEVLQSIKIIKQ